MLDWFTYFIRDAAKSDQKIKGKKKNTQMVILILSTSGHKVKLGKTAFYLTADFWKRTCLMVSSDFSTSSCVTTLCVLEHHRSGLGEH